MKLYINNEEVLKHKDDLYEFVKTYYEEYTPATYTKEDCNLNSLQCTKGKYRSFQDMLYLCQTYFPDTTDKQLAVVWRQLYKNKIIDVLWCYDIHKVTSHCNDYPECWNYSNDEIEKDENNWYRECDDGWSKDKIYKLATS